MFHSLRAVDIQKDSKIKAYSIMTTMTIEDYLKLTNNSEDNLDIQRKIISAKKSKIYDRLVEDLKTGCIIPPIVLVIRELSETLKNELYSKSDLDKISECLQNIETNNIAILDGLQRTNCIRRAETALKGEEGLKPFYEKEIRVEFWADIKFDSILYRMITLNAGQTPMSMKHQLEILNINLIDSITSIRQDIEIFRTKDGSRRTGARQYQYATLIEGYNAYLDKSPYIEAKNEVVEELNKISFLDKYDESRPTLELETFINTIVEFDILISNKYPTVPDTNEKSPLQHGYQFIGKRPFFIGFCASLGRVYNNLDEVKFEERKNGLFELLRSDDEDPLQLSLFNRIISGIPSNAKIGNMQSEVTMTGFENFFMNGYKFMDAWKFAGQKVPQR